MPSVQHSSCSHHTRTSYFQYYCRCTSRYSDLSTGWTVRASNPCSDDFLVHLYTGFETHPDSCAMDTGSFQKVKRQNACYHSVQNLLSSSLLSKNLKIKICRTIILPVVLYGCETWSLTLRDEHRLRVFENRVLRRIFGSKKDGEQEIGENYIMRSLMICTHHPILCG